ncbi:MAG TPA: M20/M25/M40 family metallo-hydrolase [Actinomycetota bacterium]|nr:M20/M25/M40 family metallo-hydrolase [Actinomycetota bacterium]
MGGAQLSTPNQETVAALMPQLKSDLARLVAIPSISALGYPAETRPALLEAHEEVVRLFTDTGVRILDPLELPDTAPVMLAEIPAPAGAPTVLLYSHYDVVPVGDESKWESPAFEATERDGAIYGRGAADTKSNILMHVGAIRAWEGKPPVGIKVVIEGQEEVGGGAFSTFPAIRPELFASDAMIIGDMGSVRPGVPTLTIALRGMMAVTVEARTLGGPKHSGQFGGAAPDALLTLIRALSSMHDANGDVAVDGLRREPWTGASYTEEEFRMLSEALPEVPFLGTGELGERIWSGPALTATGIDVLPVDGAVNAVVPYARAKVSGRIHPQQDPLEAQATLVRHFENLRPYGVSLVVHTAETGSGFAADTTGPAYAAAREALADAWGGETVSIATGGSIPLVNHLQQAAPHAEMLLFGTTDGFANIHAPNERVLVDEFEKAVLAEAEFFGRYAEAFAQGSTKGGS